MKNAQPERKGFFPRLIEEVVDTVKHKLPKIERENAEKARQLHHIRALMSSDYWPSFEEKLLEIKQDAQGVASVTSPVGDGVFDLIRAQQTIKDIDIILHFGDD
jgi:hypothetical protein